MSKSKELPSTTAKRNPNAKPRMIQVIRAKSPWPVLARWLHLYLSLLSFVLVLFFALTGLTLNHSDWFEGAVVQQAYKGILPAKWVNPADTSLVNKLAIAEFLRQQHHLRGYVSEFRIEEDACSILFRGPGYSADVYIKRQDGSYTLDETRLGPVALLNDLHKGRDTGKGWAWVIDLSAVFMSLVSLTGLWLLLFLKKRRISGLIWLVAGLGLVIMAYFLLIK
jgi:hypothetical protein